MKVSFINSCNYLKINADSNQKKTTITYTKNKQIKRTKKKHENNKNKKTKTNKQTNKQK